MSEMMLVTAIFDAFLNLNTHQLAQFLTFTKGCLLFSSTGRRDLLRWFMSRGYQ